MTYQAPGPPQNTLDLSPLNMDSTSNSYIQDWALNSTGTGITPYLVGSVDDDHNKNALEANPFETSFAPENALKPTDHTSAANPSKRTLSPGAEQSTAKPDLKQQKRPQLNLARFDSSITQSSSSNDVRRSFAGSAAAATDHSDSPASDVGYRAGGDSDTDLNPGGGADSSTSSSSRPSRTTSDPASGSMRPAYSGFGSSFDLSGTEGLSSQSFADMIQGYASQSQYTQNMPKAMSLPQQYAPTAATAAAQNQPSPLSLPPNVVSSADVPSPHTNDSASLPDDSLNKADHAMLRKQMPARNSKRGKAEQQPQLPQQAAEGAKANAAPKAPLHQQQQPQPQQHHSKAVDEKLDPEEVKRRQFLERNRVAACKSRQKKKEWVKQLESSADELNTANSELQKVVHSQQEEIAYLRNLLSSHDGCDCADVSSIQKKLTGVSAPTPRQVGYAPPQSSSSRHGSISASTPASSKVDTPASIPTSYPSPGALVPGTAQAGAVRQARAQVVGQQQQQTPQLQQAQPPAIDPMQQYTVEDSGFSLVEPPVQPTYDYFSGPAYNSLPFATPDLAELGYGPGSAA